jgi:hypothetical protein
MAGCNDAGRKKSEKNGLGPWAHTFWASLAVFLFWTASDGGVRSDGKLLAPPPHLTLSLTDSKEKQTTNTAGSRRLSLYL